MKISRFSLTPEVMVSYSLAGMNLVRRFFSAIREYPQLGFYLVLLVLFLLTWAFSLTLKPGFCRTCHEMKVAYNSWEKSPHQGINCLSCHVEPGFLNLLIDKVKASKELFLHFTGGYEKPINKGSELSKELPSENCLSCHPEQGKKSSLSVMIDHRPHLKEGLNCAYCHNRVGHPQVKQYSERMNMNFCLDCHKKKKGPIRCEACHPEGFKLTPVSHQDKNWKNKHGKEAKESLKPCLYCHYNKKAFCDRCHKLEMPHPGGWLSAHKENRSLFKLCSRCHTDPYYCEKCHHPGYSPPREKWRAVHKRVVRQKGSSWCFKCHKSNAFCNRCHLGW
jgi:nitrate/TMAO reductase-like tetraheme cytochrome c subunit